MDSMVILHLTFGGTAKLLPKGPTLFYIPLSNVGGLQFLYILANTCYAAFGFPTFKT